MEIEVVAQAKDFPKMFHQHLQIVNPSSEQQLINLGNLELSLVVSVVDNLD